MAAPHWLLVWDTALYNKDEMCIGCFRCLRVQWPFQRPHQRQEAPVLCRGVRLLVSPRQQRILCQDVSVVQLLEHLQRCQEVGVWHNHQRAACQWLPAAACELYVLLLKPSRPASVTKGVGNDASRVVQQASQSGSAQPPTWMKMLAKAVPWSVENSPSSPQNSSNVRMTSTCTP